MKKFGRKYNSGGVAMNELVSVIMPAYNMEKYIDLITNNTISIVIIAFFMYKDMTLNKTLEKALNKLQSAINILNVRLEERKEVSENGD